MSRRNLIFAALAVALVLGGAYVSSQQDNRQSDELDAVDPAPNETLVAIQDCPYGEASCILGQGIERALQRGNVNAVMSFGEPRLYVCPGPERLDAPSPLCDGVEADEGRTGFPATARFDESLVVTSDVVRARLQSFVDAIQPEASDQVGSGELTLYAFSCTQEAFPAQNLSCAREGIILSALLDRGSGLQREVLVFWVQGRFAGRTLPFTEFWDGPAQDDEIDVLFGAGGHLDDLGDVHVIDQSLPR